MPRVTRVAPGAEWNELSTTAADWKAADPGLLAVMLGQLHLIRAFANVSYFEQLRTGL